MTLASFYEDDTVWHERLVIWPSMEDPFAWYILTPDLDLYVEKYDLDAATGPNRVRMRGVTFKFWSRFREPSIGSGPRSLTRTSRSIYRRP